MSSPEEREAVRRIEESVRRSGELCRVGERELRYHSDRDDRFWEADICAKSARFYSLLAAAIGRGLLEQLEAEAWAAERHHGTWGPNGEDYIPEDGSEVHASPLLDGAYDEDGV